MNQRSQRNLCSLRRYQWEGSNVLFVIFVWSCVLIVIYSLLSPFLPSNSFLGQVFSMFCSCVVLSVFLPHFFNKYYNVKHSWFWLVKNRSIGLYASVKNQNIFYRETSTTLLLHYGMQETVLCMLVLVQVRLFMDNYCSDCDCAHMVGGSS